MSALDDLTTQVSATVSSINAAVAALGAAGNDSAQLAALTAQLHEAQVALDAAVAARSS